MKDRETISLSTTGRAMILQLIASLLQLGNWGREVSVSGCRQRKATQRTSLRDHVERARQGMDESDHLCVVRGRYRLGDYREHSSASWWRSGSSIRTRWMRAFSCFVSRRRTRVSDERISMKSWSCLSHWRILQLSEIHHDVGVACSVSLCITKSTVDVAIWDDAMKTLRASKLDTGGCEFTVSMLEQRCDKSRVQSQTVYAKDLEPANTRRGAKLDDGATPYEIHSHLCTTRQGKWLTGPDAARTVLPNQACSASQAMSSRYERQTDVFFVLHSLLLTFVSIPLNSFRFVAHSGYTSEDWYGTGWQGGYINAATDYLKGVGNLPPWSALVWMS